MFIIVRRASTFYGRITLTNDNYDGITISEGDKLIFSVKKSLKENNDEILISKTLYHYDQIDGGYPFVLSAEETDLPADKYYYDIGLQCKNGEFYHVIMPDQFIIRESIARKQD